MATKNNSVKRKIYKNPNVHKIVIITVNIIGFMYLCVISFLYIGCTPLDKDNTETIEYVYTKNSELSTLENLWELSCNLKEKGIIRSKTAFFARSFIAGEYYHYKEMVYQLSPSMRVDDVIRYMTHGESD